MTHKLVIVPDMSSFMGENILTVAMVSVSSAQLYRPTHAALSGHFLNLNDISTVVIFCIQL